jgi:hypothetical protein
MTDEEDVRRIALSLPETVQDPKGFGFSVKGKGFAWSYMDKVDPKKPRDRRPDVLAVRVADENDKQFLLAVEPEKYFTTRHYDGYPAVLVRLATIEADELEELLIDAWRSRAPRALVARFDEQRRA